MENTENLENRKYKEYKKIIENNIYIKRYIKVKKINIIKNSDNSINYLFQIIIK